MCDTTAGKQALRGRMKALRAQMTAQERLAAQEALCRQIEAYEPYRRAGTVMAYMAYGTEPGLTPAIERALSAGRRIALPRCGADGRMSARLIAGMDDLAPGAYGIMEPKQDCPLALPQEIGLILVPGLAFDRRGGRLGKGAGYYDRFMAQTTALRVGVLYGAELTDEVPMQAHDLFMDALLTADGVIITENARH